MANPFHNTSFDTPADQIAALKDELSRSLTMLRDVMETSGNLVDDLNDMIGQGEADARLTEDMIPDDYKALTDKMEQVVISHNQALDLLRRFNTPDKDDADFLTILDEPDDEDDGVEHGMGLTHHG